ncbi:LPS export ABC transporter permease LptF [Pseudorhodobacter sp.]|uniref:LPS export ABC transporter permease LptF n=1 Tax=Pseudorhodobacter sp. TaxID=1934400 RepID=UPI00264877CD|nr:LPS export ABC transporter permease LptF [Pseudorhodobacter sp.]MDN5786298.1 LPS export ABC transporter permease LptF [Pseudorhodobacter sp.]
MTRFDRYLLSQFLALFGFFSLVLVLIYWVNRAVGLFDRIIGDGQSALVFLEISLLTLPNVIRVVLPVSAFAAAVYTTNKLAQDGELVVMQATGFSAFRLARPVLYFGLSVTLMLLVLYNVIVPHSRTILAERTAEMSANMTARLLVDGKFMHPTDGITFYIRDISDAGEMQDIFLSDDRSSGSKTIYTARRALLVQGDVDPKLIMFDGMSQSFDVAKNRLSITHFSDFTYDLGGLLVAGARPPRSLDELPTRALFAPSAALLAETGSSHADFLSEAHARLAQPFLALATALIGFAALLMGAFSRFGLWRQILGAVVLLIVVQMVNNAAFSASVRSDFGWILVYIAPLLGIVASIAMLWVAQRPRRRHSAGPGPTSSEGARA